MGFPSPATDYIERRLTPAILCNMGLIVGCLKRMWVCGHRASNEKTHGDVLLILCDGHTQFAKLMGRALITDDGEAIEGAALEQIEVLGRVTFFINRALDDDCPAI
ncbi:hypothetical protein EIN43_07405 [Enterobacter hormaechei]|uniref:Uncharacterized protein n=1 Tax=Enterobacter hormaechei TaxID=158836 RepID=A0A4Y5ZNM3_9ENTR|nr:hypothetical protein EIN43_07405 [Enterobacter hormaechei]